MGVDLLVSIDLVLVNGEFGTASATSHPDLFWALRSGTAASFGVVTSLTFQLLDDPGPFSLFDGLFFPTEAVANGYQEWMASAPNNVGAYYINSVGYALVYAHCFGPFGSCAALLNPLANIGACWNVSNCQTAQFFLSYGVYLMSTLNETDPGVTGPLSLVSTSFDLNTPNQMAALNQFVRNYTAEDWPDALLGCCANSILGGVSSTLDPDRALTSVSRPCGRRKWESRVIWVVLCPLLERIDQWSENVLRPLGVDGWVYWNEPQNNLLQTGKTGIGRC